MLVTIGDPPSSKASVLLRSLCLRPALHRETVSASCPFMFLLCGQTSFLVPLPRLMSDPALGEGCLWTGKPMTLWPWLWGDSPGMNGWGKQECETVTWTKEVQLRTVVRKVLLVISPGSCHVTKVNSSPDWVAVYNISEWVCIQSPYSTIWKPRPQQLRWEVE